MNEKIDENVEKLQPFTKILMTIGELPTSYLMSMTYYEQIIWFTKYLQEQVIPAVNQNASAVEEVQQIVMDLQEYINNYFDNLDVQEEINKKLDEMAEDGTLTNLIKNYVDPIFNELEADVNEELSGMRTQLSNMINYSPIPVASTDDMTDTSQIYVNTTNGNWYYYDTDTSTWTSGGSYQAVSLSDNSVGGNKLFQNEAIQKYPYIQNYTFDADGSLLGSQYREYCDVYFPISTGDTYECTNVSGVWCCMYDSNKDFLIRGQVSNTLQTVTGTVGTANVAYIRVTFLKGYDHVLKINGNDVLNNYNVDWLNQGIKEGSVSALSMYNAELVGPKYQYVQNYVFDEDGEPVYSEYREYCDVYFPIEFGDYYSITNVAGVWCCLYDEDKNFLLRPLSSNTIHTESGRITSRTAKFIRVTFQKGYEHVFKINGIDVLNKYKIDWIDTEDISRFSTYKTLFIGDSITEFNNTASVNWVNNITNWLSIGSFTNGGMSGTGIKRTYSTHANWYNELDSYSDDYDLILIMGDMNDWSHGTDFNENNIGEFGDNTLDTFYGTMKLYLEKILDKYPKAKIGWITSTPRNQQIGSTSDYLHGNSSIFSTANNIIKEMCKNYSIPVLELYNEASLYPWLSDNNEEYFANEDGVHPNNAGHLIISYKILDFIKRNF